MVDDSALSPVIRFLIAGDGNLRRNGSKSRRNRQNDLVYADGIDRENEGRIGKRINCDRCVYLVKPLAAISDDTIKLASMRFRGYISWSFF